MAKDIKSAEGAVGALGIMDDELATLDAARRKSPAWFEGVLFEAKRILAAEEIPPYVDPGVSQ